MASAQILALVDKHLRAAFPSDARLPFGGRSVLLIGDIGQLLPFKSSVPLRAHSAGETIKIPLAAQDGLRLFERFQTVFDLRKTYRVTAVEDQAESEFQRCLRDLRLLLPQPWHFELLKRRVPSLNAPLQDGFDRSVEVHSTKRSAQTANDEALAKCAVLHNAQVARIKNGNTYLSICAWSRVMLTNNLELSSALMVGALGTVIAIAYDVGKEPPALPKAVVVQFDRMPANVPTCYPELSVRVCSTA